ERIPQPDPSTCPWSSYNCHINKYRSLDGSCNNLQHPIWGRSFIPFRRYLPPVYADGLQSFRESVIGGPLPNARLISFNVAEDRDIPDHIQTVMLMQWGQFVDHDVTLTAISKIFTDPSACSPIFIPSNDPSFQSKKCLEFVRSQEVPSINCSLDRGIMKFTSHPFSEKLKYLLPRTTEYKECRKFVGTKQCFKAGDERVNEQGILTVMHTLWIREHNRIEDKLHRINPHWDGETLYQETRRIIGAMIQHITYNEFLPTVLGPNGMRIHGLELISGGYYGGNQLLMPNLHLACDGSTVLISCPYPHFRVASVWRQEVAVRICRRWHCTIPAWGPGGDRVLIAQKTFFRWVYIGHLQQFLITCLRVRVAYLRLQLRQNRRREQAIVAALDVLEEQQIRQGAQGEDGVGEVVAAETGQPRTLRHTDAGGDAGVAWGLQRLPQNQATHILEDEICEVVHRAPPYTLGSQTARSIKSCLFQMFFQPKHLYNTDAGGIDGFLRGLCDQKVQSYDRFVTKEVTKHLFSEMPPTGLGTDLISLNIMRARDHGIPGKCVCFLFTFWILFHMVCSI
ncbi:hypothetical protein LSH36_43g07001, partial [Paralvinella palmiformis]